jgi:hypothetical protein
MGVMEEAAAKAALRFLQPSPERLDVHSCDEEANENGIPRLDKWQD